MVDEGNHLVGFSARALERAGGSAASAISAALNANRLQRLHVAHGGALQIFGLVKISGARGRSLELRGKRGFASRLHRVDRVVHGARGGHAVGLGHHLDRIQVAGAAGA